MRGRRRRFTDRRDAGRRLAAVRGLPRGDDVVVLGVARGGVPVAAEVAGRTGAPLDVVVARKIGAPEQPELALGAVAEAGVTVVDEDTVAHLDVTPAGLAAATDRALGELDRRVRRLRAGEPAPDLDGRHALVVDDGVATAATARAAVHSVRARGATRVTLAVPVSPTTDPAALRIDADALVAVIVPDELVAVGRWYDDFSPVSDAEVVALLSGHRSGA